MDEPRRPVRVSFAPDRRFTALAGLGLLAAIVAAALGPDRPGRLLALIAAVVLALYVGADLVWTPRLVADHAGLTIRSPFTRARLAWWQVDTIRTDTRARFGLRATTLEIDAGEVLAVLSRRTLSADPAEVASILEALRSSATPNPT